MKSIQVCFSNSIRTTFITLDMLANRINNTEDTSNSNRKKTVGHLETGSDEKFAKTTYYFLNADPLRSKCKVNLNDGYRM